MGNEPKRKNPAPARGTTRRGFVIGAVFGIPGSALLSSCGGKQGTGAVSGGSDGSPSNGVSNKGGSGGTAPDRLRDGGSARQTGTDGGVCTLYPQQTEGPYYLDLELVRADITEGNLGTPLSVSIEILRASNCSTLPGVAVDLWHCDAEGVYAGFPGQLGGLDTSGQRFLRGTQITDASGLVRFETIYPGWYPGRTTHIHFKVRPTGTTEATSQMYFPEDTSAEIYRTGAYSARGPKDTSNVADGVNRGAAPLAAILREGDRYEARLTVAVSD